MFGVDLSVLTDGELSVLYNALDKTMRDRTGTFFWQLFDNRMCNSIYRFLMAINTEAHNRDVAEDLA